MRAAVALLTDDDVKQPSPLRARLSVLAAVSRASFGFYFRFRSHKGGADYVLPQEREQSAVGRTRDACPCEDRRRSCETGSPYGAPPRRLWTVWDPSAPPARQAVLPALTSSGDATEDSIRGSLVSQEAFSTRPPGARLRIVRAGPPLPLPIQFRLENVPQAKGDESDV